MAEWQPIETVPTETRVLIFDPTWRVCEAFADPNGHYFDPRYDEWDGTGATHWMPLPEPPLPHVIEQRPTE